MTLSTRLLANAAAACLAASLALAPVLPAVAAEPTPPEALAVLGAAKAASGGSAWNDLRQQHSKVTLSTSGLSGPVERWSEFLTGRSYLTYSLGPTSGAIGFDGKQGWTQDSSGESRTESSRTSRELAVNTAYRDQLAFWFPDRHPATIRMKPQETRDGATFDVVSITPEGGREFDLWINADTHLIERLVEREATETRTEYYMDFRDVGMLRLPFRVRASRGDARFDEIVNVDSIDFDPPKTAVAFDRPPPPKPDFTFPAGKASVEVPFTLANGHMYVDVKLAGKGPFRMLFDSGGVNVLFPSTAKSLGLTAQGGIAAGGVGADKETAGVLRVPSLEIGGIVLADQEFVTLALEDSMRRIEGVDRVAGLVGYELFKRFPVRIDYVQRKLTFYDPAQWKYAGSGVKVPISFKQHIPQVEGSIDGIAGTFDIDTGARGSLTLGAPFSAANDLAARYHATPETITGAGVGGPSRGQLARAGVLKLGDVEVAKPVTVLSTAQAGAFADPSLAGNVGYGVLSHFDLVFDYRNEVIWFEKNSRYAMPDVHDRAGLWVERDAKGFKVVDVLAGAAGAKAGVKAGDVIVALDGKPVKSLSLDELRARLKAAPGTRVVLGTADGRKLTLTLQDIV